MKCIGAPWRTNADCCNATKITRTAGTERLSRHYSRSQSPQEASMGRGILLWLLGVPIPIIILIMLFAR
ncbi:MAG: hypothetical protein E5W81_15290 [Mesorhizobium sp.]|nr:MAG: hypothetical protein E5V36_06105 [Mesorhizobium sp.]TKB76396.1 MAG: hypothetical protein E5W81_15290 [Mesorhizobium sp.]